MNFIQAALPGVVIIEPSILRDERGYFFESFRADLFKKHLGDIIFVQDNESKSSYGVLRGLHYQILPFEQSKLVRVIKGKIWDVIVDIRNGSRTFGKHRGIELSEDNKKMLFIPRGFAHGFVTLSDEAILTYKVDNYYSKEHERGIVYNDSELNIDWKINTESIVLSEKDKALPQLREALLL